jgi:hypothetical protein
VPDPDAALDWLADIGGRTRHLADIVATVDLERALADLRGDGVGGGQQLVTGRPDAVEDPLLGARVVVLTTEAGAQIALAEPSTEGRLAGTLARHGEGRAGAYWRVPVDLDVVRAAAAEAHVALSPAASGPFGRSVLVLGERFAARHAILVEPAAVPSRP